MILAFVLGAFVGGALGILIASLLVMARNDDEQRRNGDGQS